MTLTPASASPMGVPPPIFSAPRITTLLASMGVSLTSGTNYVYSAYAPQLGARLKISHTQLNIVGLAGNVGVYISGPIWGRIVDSRGPQSLLAFACVLLFSGYSGIGRMFDAGVPEGANTLSTWHICLLVACSFMTGAGGNAGLTGGLNSTAKTFPDRLRATAAGLVLSGFGLSAFLFSTLFTLLAPGDTSAFLKLLAVGTAAPMVGGFFLIRPVPLPEEHHEGVEEEGGEEEAEEEEAEVHGEGYEGGDGYGGERAAAEEEEEEDTEYWEPVIQNSGNWGKSRSRNTDRSRLLAGNHTLGAGAGYAARGETTPLVGRYTDADADAGDVEEDNAGVLDTLKDLSRLVPARLSSPGGLNDLPSPSGLLNDLRTPSGLLNDLPAPSGLLKDLLTPSGIPKGLQALQDSETSNPLPVTPHDIAHDASLNIFGRALFLSGDFWLLFAILSMLSGTGLMYINNVGAMSQALYAHATPPAAYDPAEAARWQSVQVSAISVMNSAGRIFIGLISDRLKSHHRLPRSYCLALVSLFCLASQLAAAHITDVRRLWVASALLGLAHGSAFAVFPTMCIEWFGMPHFSENWGYLSISPVIAGNIFSIFFGRNLDAHERDTTTAPLLALTAPQCLEGLECYVATLHLTSVAAVLSFALSVWAGWRDQRRIAAREAGRRRVKYGMGMAEGEAA